ncbi:hypothetical protein [Pseudomonas abietaniphila]|uniref:hypothetical protein n=1 Tax=Pseudomonas abietaniphila TaxID=89065 RepID=UPI000781DE1E|nr:hypothetical protein [Pseudomonas abietaniphila]
MNVAEVLQQVESLEPGMQKAYLDSIRSTISAATLAEVERLLSQNDEDGLVALLSLGAMALLAELVRSAYIGGARFEFAAIFIPAADRPIVGRKEFDVALQPAANWIQQQTQSLRSTASAEVREAIRAVMGSRRVIVGAKEIVRTDRQAALDLVGRVSSQTGQRVGGVVGLPGNMAQYVVNARSQLLSGDPVLLKQYLGRSKRDRRYDKIVQRAIDAAKPVAQADVEKIAGRYSERLLKYHAEVIAQTNAHESFSAGRERAWEQLVEQGIDRNRVEKEWRTRRDEKVRKSHAELNGQRVILGQAFSGGGALLKFPGDMSLGAGYDMTANCRCICIYQLKR